MIADRQKVANDLLASGLRMGLPIFQFIGLPKFVPLVWSTRLVETVLWQCEAYRNRWQVECALFSHRKTFFW